ncbi:MAG TPA: ASKHA domain-containing protein, partial [Burkholderiales bacterium]|nr:ASKHA domain-containing protein [Burkholderiales bacterium]
MTDVNCTIEIVPDGIKVRAKAGELLADVMARAGIPLSVYCHKRGVCGKCAVRVRSGLLPLLEAPERALLAKRGLSPDHRLACRFFVRGDMNVELPPESRLGKIAVLETGLAVPVALDPQVKKFSVTLEKPPLEAPTAVTEVIDSLLGPAPPALTLAALRHLRDLESSRPQAVTAVLYGEREALDIEAGDTSGRACGLAVDIGTSTVVAELVDLVAGAGLGRASAMNSQASYGADVVSRITFAFQNADNLRRLRKSIVHLLNQLAGELCAKAGVAKEAVYEVVVAGNTAMNHFLCGVATDSLAVSPFQAVFSSLPPFPASEIGLDLQPSARVYVVPNIKSFVGGDITAGLAAAALAEKPGRSLFVDIGTNGEIVLKKGREFVATSTAAGPAFEGMSISCGMLAVEGAVHRAEWQDGYRLQTIGGRPPHGLCGTGLVDVLALALAHGLIGRDGKIAGPEKKLRLGDKLSLSQNDVREVQLATAAIKTGIRLLLRECAVTLKSLEAVYVAGAFGNWLDIPNAQALGLLPVLGEKKIVFIGNSSLAGARKLLLSAPERGAAESLARSVVHVSLAARPDFQETFVKAI